MKQNIFLLGFMGCGKSYWANKIAQKTTLENIDLDDFIEKGAQLSISQIFEQKGEKKFRALEQKYLHLTQKLSKRTIIALGGGTPCFFDNMKWINNNGISIFLDMPASTLFQNLVSETEKRPLLQNKTEEELLDFIQTKLIERAPYYEQADYIVNDAIEIEQLLNNLLNITTQ